MSLTTTLDRGAQATGWPGIAERDRRRMLLGLLTVAAGAATLLWRPAAPVEMDAELARLLRFMALLKGGFALAAFGAAWWRLARPAASWRSVVYLVSPGMMAGGAIALAQLHAPGLATIGLHAGMVALLAAALTDEGFIPPSWRRAGSRPA